ncbi:salicylate hydroxylase [Thelephora terrestris]|uniref:Salicylate hydroxylase n=1 Tax=Thelephora terrestris TaxID=56493 RepID=A0A9P6HJ71_9AGAM|nr:salicylate hydroxylase [Thelephora terrestris]
MDSLQPSFFSSSAFKQLRVAIVGGGIGGLSAAVALRRAGHVVEIFERRTSDVEVSSFLACAANGSKWLREWEVDISMMKPFIAQKYVIRDWETGHILKQFELDDYEATWGSMHYIFHRKDLHKGLLHAATSEEGKGTPCKFFINYSCESVDYEAGVITFTNGRTVTADLIVGADGIRSVVRDQIGITPNARPAAQTCYRGYVRAEEIKHLGLASRKYESVVQVWGGTPGKNGRSNYYKTVMSPCSGGDVVAIYCFMPAELTNHHREEFKFEEVPVEEVLQGNYSDLDPDCASLIKHCVDRMPWRLYVHQPYEYWHKGKACILGDAAHPMPIMWEKPHQAQGACQAIEDAAALGIIFSNKYNFTNSVEAGVSFYEKIRKYRATRVQQASIRGGENTDERIGFARLPPHDMALAVTMGKLTANEINFYNMQNHIAAEVGSRLSLGTKHVPSRL